jgi:SNF2 family DNA or RNA helicase
MGVAINLQQGSHYAIFAERDWSPAAQEQALRRLWRLGQDLHVHVDICEADHPIDEAVSLVVARKGKSANRVMN